jgi:hypothetical protein
MSAQEKPWFAPKLSPNERLNRIGEVLYPKLHALWKPEKDTMHPKTNAGQMTGMLITGLPLKEVDELLEDDAKLLEKYEECKKVLEEHHRNS